MSDSLQPPGLQPTSFPLSMEFFRQEYWSGLPFPPPGDLPNPGIEPTFPALAGRSFTAEPLGKPNCLLSLFFFFYRTLVANWEDFCQYSFLYS